MRNRIISGVVLLPILVFLIVYGGLPLHITNIIISAIGLYEFYKAMSGKIVHVIILALQPAFFTDICRTFS